MSVPVQVEGLVARYGQLEVLSGVDLLVAQGEVRVILGGSGSGKSTLLKHVVGLREPHAGAVRLLGCAVHEADEAQREAVMRRIGMLFQNGALLNSLTLHDNVALPMRQRGTMPAAVIDELVRMKLSLVGLAHAAHRMPKELSGGMVKRAALARAMALDPELLVCDEPSAGLDPVTAAQLDELIVSLRDRFGMAVVVVTHELDSIRTIADRVTMLDRGRVIADGTQSDVRRMDHPVVRAFFDRSPKRDAGTTTSVLHALGGSTGG